MSAAIVMPDGDPTCRTLYDAPPRAKALERLGGLELYEDAPLPSIEVYLERCADARGIILGWPLPAEVLRLPRLEVVTFMGTGVANHVDLELARAADVAVYNTPGYGDTAVAEHAIALLLTSLRDIPDLNSSMQQGVWPPHRSATELFGSTVGLVGFGGIGQAVARLLHAFGATVLAWTPNPDKYVEEFGWVEFAELTDLFGRSSIVSLHVRLDVGTEGLIDADLLGTLADGALLVNTARAELVDEEALIREVSSGRLRAALDVFAAEPLPSGHPYRDLPGAILTPHVAFDTPAALQRMADITVQNLVDHFGGGGPNRVI